MLEIEAKIGTITLGKKLSSLDGALREIATYLEGDIRQNITKGIDYRGNALKPLRPSTVASKRQRRKASGILQSDGLLRASVISRLGSGFAEVGWLGPFYAPYVILGTRPYKIRPRGKRRLRFYTENGYRSAREVNHPGLPPREVIGIGDRQITSIGKILQRYLD